MEKLKPCPFCGGRAVMVEGKYQAPGKFSATCGVCFCSSPWETSEENAVHTWNRRVERQKKAPSTFSWWGERMKIL